MIKLMIPSNIDVENLHRQIVKVFPNLNSYSNGKTLQYTERCLILFHLIYISSSNNKWKHFYKDEISEVDMEWNQINHLVLSKVFATSKKSKYTSNDFMNFLKEEYIRARMYSDDLEFYKTGSSCKQYQFQFTSNFVPYQIKSQLVNRLYLKLRYREANSELLNKDELEFRRVAANNANDLTLLRNKYVDKVLNNKFKKNKIYTPNEFINNFNGNSIPSSIDSFGLRCFTKISNLNGSLLKYLRKNKEQIVCTDISNSQPYFASILNEKVIDKLFIGKDWKFLELVKPIYVKYQTNKDFIQYQKICKEGMLYDYLAVHFSKLNNKSFSRDDAKKLYLTLSYCDYNHMKPDEKKELQILERLFPSVVALIRELKSIDFECKEIKAKYKKKGKKRDQSDLKYKNTALLFQRSESFFIYHKLGEKLIEKDIWFTTIHDSIVCLKEDQQIVNNEFRMSFEELGVKPPTLNFK